MKASAGLLSTAEFIGFGTWKWLEWQAKASEAPVYRYEFDQTPPVEPQFAERGNMAYHSAEIEYVFGTLNWKKLPWTEADRKVSELMQSYWTNFAKSGNPNGMGLPEWPEYGEKHEVMYLSADAKAMPDEHRTQYVAIDEVEQGLKK
jgi:para-nitrobenzyl esterase